MLTKMRYIRKSKYKTPALISKKEVDLFERRSLND